MTAFADSSAVVKFYAEEEGQDMVRALGGVAIAQVARVEVPTALWRKQRMGELRAAEAQLLSAEFEADYFGADDDPARFAVVALSAEIFEDAARLCAVHGLRTYEAVQLATARAVRIADPSCTDIAVFDTDLRTAAAIEGFGLIPPDSEA